LNFEEKTIKRREIFNGRIIHVVEDEVELPNNLGKSTREIVFHPGGVCAIPITKEGKIVLVKQFRKPLEVVTLEIPAGKIEIEENDNLEEAAKRELEEETGYSAKTFYKVVECYLSPGFSNELLHFYFATDLKLEKNPRPRDADEVLEVCELTLAEAKKKIKIKEICDSKTIMAIWFWELQILRRN